MCCRGAYRRPLVSDSERLAVTGAWKQRSRYRIWADTKWAIGFQCCEGWNSRSEQTVAIFLKGMKLGESVALPIWVRFAHLPVVRTWGHGPTFQATSRS